MGSTLEARVLALASEGSIYEAGQAAEGAAARAKRRGDVPAAVRALAVGARTQLAHGAANAAVALGRSAAELAAGDAGLVAEVVTALGADAQAARDVACAAAAAASKAGRSPDAAHVALGNVLDTLGRPLHEVSARLARGGEAGAESLARVVANAASSPDVAKEKEVDLFLARAALECMSLGRRDGAHALLPAFERTPGAPRPPNSPLMHFVGLFLDALDRGSAPLAEMLRDRYSRSIARDPQLEHLVDRAVVAARLRPA